MRETLSPTPPVECLSTFAPGMSCRSMTSPERIMASVSHAVSCGVMPRQKMAMSSAVAW
jgi:hypothetical protein